MHNRRFGAAFLGVLLYKAIAWSLNPATTEWSDEVLAAAVIAAFVTAVLALCDWLEARYETASEAA